jgi:hypothetical protein
MTKLESAVARFDKFYAEGRLTRHEWRDRRDGKDYACALSAFSLAVYRAAGVPEDERTVEPVDACPANLLPLWFARLTPWINDLCAGETWLQTVLRWRNIVAVAHSTKWWARALRALQIVFLECIHDHLDMSADERVYLDVALTALRAGQSVESIGDPTTAERRGDAWYPISLVLMGQLSATTGMRGIEFRAVELIEATLSTLESLGDA